MRPIAIVIAVLLAPVAAEAQSAGSALGTPYEEATGEAPVLEPATPTQARVDATAALPAAPMMAVPVGYGARLGSAVPQGVDPEILRLRRGSASQITLRPVSAAPYQEPEPFERPARRPASYGASFGYAWAGFGIGTAVGGLAGAAVGAAVSQDFDTLLSAFLGAGLGAATLAPLGAGIATWGFSDRRGGTGNVFAAVGGAYLGAGLGAGLTAAIAQTDDPGYSFIGVLVGIVATNLGAAAGYHLSSNGAREPSERASTDPVVVPTLSGTDDREGLMVGAAGMF